MTVSTEDAVWIRSMAEGVEGYRQRTFFDFANVPQIPLHGAR